MNLSTADFIGGNKMVFPALLLQFGNTYTLHHLISSFSGFILECITNFNLERSVTLIPASLAFISVLHCTIDYFENMLENVPFPTINVPLNSNRITFICQQWVENAIVEIAASGFLSQDF
ncbi:uncharacterized protein ASCRUDRAFT_77072 [Ascoidea rubescens DSM 1968]|uniref:Uncharacterized protein n=1 Tax=Ascoidea rubescens DSM 1968 TaxID=1344418 RepID=A0A1D2VC98_9ASCO|nr:hypothetical protein ASCRUDRAFT_77072 [Ascoidea rubescens DSM 1968]ODV59308.1 hypothetical protein ASCRUDRAFT_77072 [Ascoidea rubescens DSM 1968]